MKMQNWSFGFAPLSVRMTSLWSDGSQARSFELTAPLFGYDGEIDRGYRCSTFILAWVRR